MQSAIIKRSIVIDGHKTSVSLEDPFWESLKEIGRGQQVTLSKLVAKIDAGRPYGNLSSSIRLFVLDHFRELPAQTANVGAGIDEPRIQDNGQHNGQHTNGRTSMFD